ncbi:unnamed protein product [Phytophthora fragariaefolia]|uniref:Unnamed protein product n=1 Tax=Phytophthora fragariaefolia TaxID=1490495 RepID=A0A9W6WNZ2_9STRA|nr:unnamed protein product [Phytophthora fragariaefolia]
MDPCQTRRRPKCVSPLWRFSRVASDSRSSLRKTSRACVRPSLPSGKAGCPCATTLRRPATWFRASSQIRSTLPPKCTSLSSGCVRHDTVLPHARGPSTLEAAFALVLREFYTVGSSYARVLTSDAQASTPEPMEIDAIETKSRSRSRSSSTARGLRFNNDNLPRDSRPLICYRCRKSGHRAAVCRAPAPVLASAEVVGDADDMFPTAHPKKRSGPVGAGRSTGWNGGPGPPVATGPPSPPVLHAHFNATTTNGDSRLILISLHVAGAERPLRALLDSGATKNFICDDCIAVLPEGGRRQVPPRPAAGCLVGRHPFADDSIVEEILRDTGMTETEVPCLEEDEVLSSETSASSTGSRRLRKSIRNRSGRRRLRRRPTAVNQAPSSESVNVVEYSENSPNRIRTVEVAYPPSDAATITRLPGLSWKHFLRDLKAGEIEQVCLLTVSDQPTMLANVVSDDATSPRPNVAEPKSVREARFAAQSWAALQDSNNPDYSLAREFEDIFPVKIPAEFPAERGVRYEIDLVPGAKYCVPRQWPLAWDQVQAIDEFFEGSRKAGHKCTFCAPEILVLGCYVSRNGVRADPEKISSICSWPTPKNQTELRQWLGLANYLHKYTKDYAGLIQPMSSLLKKDVAWDWRPEHQDAFDAVKKGLASEPSSCSPTHQDRSTRPNYDPWRLTRHRNIPDDDDDCVTCVTLGINATVSSPVLPLRQQIADAYEEDAFYAAIIPYLRNPTADTLAKLTRPTRDTITRYDLGGDLMTYAIDTFDPPRVVIPADDDLRAPLVHEYHDAPAGGHLGHEKTFAALSRDFFWPRLLPESIVSDRDPRFTSALWTRLFALPGTRLLMSTTAHPETDGQTERVNRVLEDVLRSYATSFTSWSSFLPMAEFVLNNATNASTGLTPFFVNNARHPRVPALLAVRSPHAAPGSTLGGRGRAPTSKSVHESSESPLPQSATSSAQDTTPEDHALHGVAYEEPLAADAAAPAASIVADANFTPKPTPTPIESEAVSELLLHRQAVTRFVHDVLQVAVDRQKDNADRRGRKNMLSVRRGKRDLLSTDGIQGTAVTNLGASKLAPRFIGPFKILKVVGDTYTLDIPTAMRPPAPEVLRRASQALCYCDDPCAGG